MAACLRCWKAKAQRKRKKQPQIRDREQKHGVQIKVCEGQRYFCDAEDDVYGGGQRVDGAHQFNAHHLRQGQRHRLAQHHGFRLDAPDTWPQDRKTPF